MKKIIPALALLLISAVVLSTASYAWFSMNTTVTATGMSVTAKVESNLLIAYGEAGTTMKFDSEYGREVKQSVSGILQPVSTVNGVNFFYTQNAKANGDAEEDKYETLTNNTIAINTIDYNGYVDYVFDLKATNTGNDISYIRLSKLNLLYDKAAVTDDKAARVAVFVQEAGAVETDAADTFPTTANVIYTLAGAANFTTGEAVNSTTTLSSVTYNVTTVFEDSMQVLAHSDKYYKVTIRLWIEGEDTTCYSSKFKNLDKAWTLGVEFELTTEDSTVTNIGSTPDKINFKSGHSGSGDPVEATTYESDEISLYIVAGETFGGKQIYTDTPSSLTSSSKLYTLDEASRATNITSNFELPTA